MPRLSGSQCFQPSRPKWSKKAGVDESWGPISFVFLATHQLLQGNFLSSNLILTGRVSSWKLPPLWKTSLHLQPSGSIHSRSDLPFEGVHRSFSPKKSEASPADEGEANLLLGATLEVGVCF